MTQLLAVLDSWTIALDEGGNIDSIYLDFAKAFDTVPHQRLLVKQRGYGIEGRILTWIKAFLTDRRAQLLRHQERLKSVRKCVTCKRHRTAFPAFYLYDRRHIYFNLDAC